MLLSFFGFLGGILAFGLIGLFLGPVLLAWDTAYSLNGRRPTVRRLTLQAIFIRRKNDAAAELLPS